METTSQPTIDDIMQSFMRALQTFASTRGSSAPPVAEERSTTNAMQVPKFEPSEDPDAFDDFIKRFRYSVELSSPNMSDADKVKCLMTALDKAAFSQYARSCVPKEPIDFTFEESVERLRDIFGKQSCLARDRFECWHVKRGRDEDIRSYINRVKVMLQKFKFKELTEDIFNTLVLLSGFVWPEDEAIRTRILQQVNEKKEQLKFTDVETDVLNIIATKELRQLPNWTRLEQLYRRRNALSIEQECVLFENRIVIPLRLQMSLLKQFHRGHPGIQRMKSLARLHAYWPLMDAQIEECVRNCDKCAAAAKQPVKTELHSWPKATRPWQRVHIDYAGPHLGKYFLVIVDAFSKFPEIFVMKSTTSDATLTILRALFARYGMPES